MRQAITGFLIFFAASLAVAFSINLDPSQSGGLVVGANAGSPTQVFTRDPLATKSCVINISTNTIYFVGFSTTSYLQQATNAPVSVSVSTGSFSLPGTSATIPAQQFCFDGNDGPFTGPLWAVSGGAGSPIQRVRTH